MYASTEFERILGCELDLNGSAWDQMVRWLASLNTVDSNELSGSIHEGK